MTDGVVRALTDDGAFRVITVRTTDTVRGAVAAQGLRGGAVRVFADLLTGTTLVRETMSPDLRVQGIVQSSDTKSRMVVDSHPDGATRGLVQVPPGLTAMPLAGGGLIQMMRTLHNGALHQGVVSVPDEGTIASALMRYMQESEQVVSMVDVGCVQDGDEVRLAGGYIVQLLPEVGEGPLMVMTERLKDFPRFETLLAEGRADPHALLDELLYAMPYSKVGEREVAFRCQCSPARVAASLASLPRQDIESFITAGDVLDIACDYCKREYKIAPEQLRGLLQPN